jgi:hypothetical protein
MQDERGEREKYFMPGRFVQAIATGRKPGPDELPQATEITERDEVDEEHQL